jgi:ATP-dependent DNA ligase
VDYKKPKYKQVSAAEIDKLFNNDSVLSEKIDGAQALLSVMNDSVRIMSYRTDKSGKPIVHTDRLRFKQPDTVPAEYRNRQFVGELWASKNNKAVPHSTLSALLNSTPENARKRMAVESIKPHMALFGEITNTDKWYDMPVNKRRAIIQDFIKAIGMGNQLHEPEYAYTREEKRNLWNKILDKSNLRTREGVISYPFSGGKPIKVKIRPEMDVYIKDLLTGSGKFKDMNSRFAYSTQPGGPVKGIVGTGFSDEDREMMTNDPSAYIGRKARVNYQDVFNSGALRAPSFISLHEE